MEIFIANKKRISSLLLLTIFLTCFGSSMLYGYNMAVINLPADKIQCFLNETILMVPCRDAYDTSKPNYNISILNNSTRRKIDANFLYAQTSTVFVIAGIIGAFSSGWIADFFGRRNGLLMNHTFVIIGAIIIGLTVKTRNFALLYIGRFFIGINSGITISLASMYLTEIAPRIYRGAIGACHQLAVTSGIVIGYLLTMTHTMNTDSLWPVACASTAIPAIISLCLLPICPESPRFLFLKKFKENLARKEFIRINKIEDVEIFLGELRNEIEISKNQQKFTYIQLFTQKDLRMPLAIACLIQVMQQISGINAKAIGGYSFLLYLVILMFCWMFFFFYMPETKNRTVDDVAHDLAFGVTVVFRKKTQILTHPVYDKISTNNKAMNNNSTET